MTSRLLASNLPFQPDARVELPSLAEAAAGGLRPSYFAALAAAYIQDLTRVHYHCSLVRLVEENPDIAGLRLKGKSLLRDSLLSTHTEVLPLEEGDATAARRAVRRVEKALGTLRGQVGSDRATMESVMAFGPLDPTETFVLDRGSAAAYLARLRLPQGVGDWLTVDCLARTWGKDIPDAEPLSAAATRRSPRM